MPNPHPDPESLPAFIAELRDRHFAHGLRCPHCGVAEGLHRWGRFAGRQRYRCSRCRRTFSDFTGTPAHQAKKLHLWPAYMACVRDGLSVRRAAAQVGIHPSSAFRWRHVLLDELNNRDTTTLSGCTEVTSLRFSSSEKGSRRLRRPPRRRGLPHGKRLSAQHALVLLACDRLGSTFTAVLRESGNGIVTGGTVAAALGERIAANSILIAQEGRFGPVARFARRSGSAFLDARRSVRQRPPLAHTAHSQAYVKHLLGWIRRFRGVATVYLANYLVWHRAIEDTCTCRLARVLLGWPVPYERR